MIEFINEVLKIISSKTGTPPPTKPFKVREIFSNLYFHLEEPQQDLKNYFFLNLLFFVAVC
jgi:hypothetical protein